MTSLRSAPPATTYSDSSPAHPARRKRAYLAVAAAATVVVLGLAVGIVLAAEHVRTSDLRREYLGPDGWPRNGQAAYQVGAVTRTSPAQKAVPIASLAKVMTAYVVLRSLPLRHEAGGPTLVVSRADVEDYLARRHDDQSVVEVRVGERLSERQALMAMLLPSANNVAVLLARHTTGSERTFVARMNAAAHRLGMTSTHYTDPSGYDAATVSTARDQLVLAAAVARDETFSRMVATTSYRLPVAGTVHNTDSLLGQDGFVGTKTGSDDKAGGCFMFRTWRVVHGRVSDVLGVVLGQRGRHAITAGLYAGRQLAERIGPPAGG